MSGRRLSRSQTNQGSNFAPMKFIQNALDAILYFKIFSWFWQMMQRSDIGVYLVIIFDFDFNESRIGQGDRHCFNRFFDGLLIFSNNMTIAVR